MSVLSLNNLYAGYGQTEVLHDVSIFVNPNEIVAIIGPNGAGKSTAMKSVLGLLTINSGNVELNGKDITNTPAAEVVRLGISYVPQTQNVFVNLSVQENLEMGAWTRPLGIRERLAEMFELFPDLGEKRNQAAGSLSGGQRQMVAMAKALMVDAKILLLDEPTAGLSPKYRGEIFTTIQKIKSTGVPILIVEQNAKQALGVADRGYVLVDGANRYTGKGKELLEDREIARMFLGGGH
ncbi:ABC transporter ATP-binding protein [Planktomarina temperata]|jgi:branched-chain amino acid transport system ATP-binding protein|uniref:ABC transporter ATP-binding protein n=1 Tax=Planktomarina temperata TaxID=1284658 RepID=UPI001E066F61|nr:ABC transporter ATP-binding protein [Marinovum sp.]MBT6545934.1 ABC transporter ATP-binding protein [Paracoccaceae bacterium]MDA7458178.1 ABC transporter ATP-binding protein [Planktomarina temperata]MDA9009783.1 ABC transporter ATP-binding protein [bacterium]MDP4063389.1 High-affinity branched-chain amino acid transport ATP-binding protein LivF [Rhodobacteraceae bacterium IMCC1923]MDP4067467.1 High-affinity branched-chain amino acid transport ATP-binding protein LivF [Rhodobacteraceae bacte